MLDKSLPYYNIIMKWERGRESFEAALPGGYRLVDYRDGDEQDWAVIEKSVLEFDSLEEGLRYFRENYEPFREQLYERMFFVEDPAGEKIATLTAWREFLAGDEVPAFHWFGVKKEHQGKGIGKALAAEALRRFKKWYGDGEVYLHTQTWSYTAVILYRKAGFRFCRHEALDGTRNDYSRALSVLQERVPGWRFD